MCSPVIAASFARVSKGARRNGWSHTTALAMERAMLGYWLASDAAGRGVGRQAIALALTWARNQPTLHTVWAVAADTNFASRRILEVNRFEIVATRGIDERGDVALLYELELDDSRRPILLTSP